MLSELLSRPTLVRVLVPSIWIQIAGISVVAVIDAPFHPITRNDRESDYLHVRFSGAKRIEAASVAAVEAPAKERPDPKVDEDLQTIEAIRIPSDRAMAELDHSVLTSVRLTKQSPLRELPSTDELFSLKMSKEFVSQQTEKRATPAELVPEEVQNAPQERMLPRSNSTIEFKLSNTAVSIPQIVGTDEFEPPKFSNNRPPSYPVAAYRAGIEGEVLLEVHVSETGHVERIEVSRSSGHSILDNAARDAVKQWKGTPASKNGRVVATVEYLPVRFQLRRN